MWHPPHSYPASQALCTSYLPTEVPRNDTASVIMVNLTQISCHCYKLLVTYFYFIKLFCNEASELKVF